MAKTRHQASHKQTTRPHPTAGVPRERPANFPSQARGKPVAAPSAQEEGPGVGVGGQFPVTCSSLHKHQEKVNTEASSLQILKCHRGWSNRKEEVGGYNEDIANLLEHRQGFSSPKNPSYPGYREARGPRLSSIQEV